MENNECKSEDVTPYVINENINSSNDLCKDENKVPNDSLNQETVDAENNNLDNNTSILAGQLDNSLLNSQSENQVDIKNDQNCTSDTENVVLIAKASIESKVNDNSAPTESFIEEDNLHGLSVDRKSSSDNDMHQSTFSEETVSSQNDNHSRNYAESDNSEGLSFSNKSCREKKETSLLNSFDKEWKSEEDPSCKNKPELSNSNLHTKNISKQNYDVDKQVQNLIQENLAEFSPKKVNVEDKNEPQKFLSCQTNSIKSSDKSSRINPFNSIDTSDETSELWQIRHSPKHHQTTSLSPNEDLNIDPGIQNSKLPAQEYNPQFKLMSKSNYARQNSSEIDSSPDTEDIEAVVREVKMKTNSLSLSATQRLDDPWVKLDDKPKPESLSAVSEQSQTPQSLKNHLSKTEIVGNQNQNIAKQSNSLVRPLIEAAGPCDPADLIDGIIFTANYLGSTQLQSERNPGKNARMMQAQEAVGRIKAPEGESQPSVEVDLFISTDRVKILNADTQETMMDHTLRSISYIADIGKLLVIMAKRRAPQHDNQDGPQIMRDPKPQRSYRIVCHVFTSIDSHLMAQAIGQAFNVAYQQFLSANGIEPQTLTRDDYNELLDMQEMYHDDLVHYSKRENIKDIWVEKKKGESLGVVVVESGWGSIVPTVILANLQHGGPAERCGKLSIGDQIMSVNGTSLVGLPLATCQSIIKGLKAQSIARLHIVSCPPVVTVLIKRPDLQYQLGFSVQEGVICSLMRGGIAERGGVRVGHRIIEINNQSVVATQHEKIVQTLISSVGEIQMKTMPAMMYRLLTGQEQPIYI